VSQPSDADPGEYIQDDAALRQVRSRAVAARGSATTAAILAKVSTEFADELVSVAVFENDTDYTDGDGRPPHSVEVLLYDGSPAAIANNTIAQTIAGVMAGGVATYGNASGTAQVVDGTTTVSKTINFSRAVAKPVYLEFDITTRSGYIGDSALKERIASRANEAHTPGNSVAWSYLVSLLFSDSEATGVAKCTEVRVGFSPSPTLQQDLSIALREIARFDTGDIVINVT
jgi:hypothetical protein